MSSDRAENIAAAVDVVAKRLTAEIVAPADSHNGGRLSGDQASGLAHLAVYTLLTQGWAVVRLPESRQSGIVGQIEWPAGGRYDGVVRINHCEQIVNDGVGNPYQDAQAARDHAVALLAAADELLGETFND